MNTTFPPRTCALLKTTQRGAAAIEFALVLPILIALLYGIVTFGDLFYTQMIVTRAASDAARAVSALPKSADSTAQQTKANSVAQDSLRTTYPVLPVGTNALINGPRCTVGGAQQISIQVNLPYQGMLPAITLPVVGTVGWGNRDLVGCAVAQV